MRLLVTGISHKTAPVELRERLAIPEAAQPEALRGLRGLGAAEALVLSTCNRVEIAVTTPDGEDPFPTAMKHFAAIGIRTVTPLPQQAPDNAGLPNAGDAYVAPVKSYQPDFKARALT